MRVVLKGLFIGLAVLAAVPSMAEAKPYPRHVPKRYRSAEWKQEQGWLNQSTSKFAYGAKNALFGWTELITEPYEAAMDPKRNVVEGLGKGLWNGIGKTVGGAVDLVTFPMPELSVPMPQ